MKIGEIMAADREITLNEGKKTVTVTVANKGDRPFGKFIICEQFPKILCFIIFERISSFYFIKTRDRKSTRLNSSHRL